MLKELLHYSTARPISEQTCLVRSAVAALVITAIKLIPASKAGKTLPKGGPRSLLLKALEWVRKRFQAAIAGPRLGPRGR